jgi:transketolase
MAVATREAYGKALAQIVVEDPNVVVMDADLSKSTKTADAKAVCPERHFNAGIAEADLMGISAGLAASGKVVYASTFAVFAAGRAFDQIRNSIAYPKLNVKICATHAGLTVGEDGASHQSVEDIALMRSIPNMKVLQPCDDIETEAMIKAIKDLDGPVYVRLGRMGVERIHDESYQFHLGKGEILQSGRKVAILATGMMVQQALKAAELLETKSVIKPTVVNFASIKPLDEDLLLTIAKTHDLLVTCEEANVLGGFGSAVCEVLSEKHPIKIVRIGINDTFGESGKPDALIEKYGLSAKAIADTVSTQLKK